ncbi:hypothetical protein BKK81_22460 [Cupriavidus sp. USMAHM13]|uniref:F0F1 ATP synthase subunit gamma n=1 Tax=Cupriavidus sp. USMAHM13 TaxID=1389192 RepID=UPI0008A6874E|nr:F0F1 ATP synthase subunit gamma [Cupriavidus sp. USMAHM13]AOZ02089.1 hypothetical protein BKK81_22460 [Cupriavidus sp. USMAHM13]
MSTRRGELQARIAGVRQLEAVVGAVRGMAASRSAEARAHLPGVHACAAMLAQAIGDALALAGAADPAGAAAQPPRQAPAAPATPRVSVVIGSDQGFVGTFNERLLDTAQAGAGAHGTVYYIVGQRAAALAAERGLAPAWSAPMAAHPGDVAALATRLAHALEPQLAAARPAALSAWHACPPPATSPIRELRLLPFDYGRFTRPAHRQPPLASLPAPLLLARLAESYIHTQLCEALLQSFAAENEARMRTMLSARDHVRATLARLEMQAGRERQEQITNEIIELGAAGAGEEA